MAGWHDLMCAVLAGHEVHVKLSKDDAVLPRWAFQQWCTFCPGLDSRVTFHDGMMKGMDAVVATGGQTQAAISNLTSAICLTCSGASAPLSRCSTGARARPS